jgi:AraC-like DNA-binding protein
MNPIITSIISGSLFLLAFISVVNPGKANVAANRWMSLLYFSTACAIASTAITDETTIAWMELTRFAMAPALFLGVLYFTSPDKKFKAVELLHFVPFLLFAVFGLTSIIPASFKEMLEQFIKQTTHINPGFLVFGSLVVQVIAYWILSWTRLKQHERNVKLFASSSQPVDLWWLRYLLIGLALIVLLWLNANFIQITIVNTYAAFGHLFAVYFIAYFSLRQGEIFAFDKQSVIEIKEIIQEETTKSTAKAPRATDAELTEQKVKLESLMTTDKLYLNPTLGLPELAARAGLTSHQLSYLINEGFGENFYQFVNRYRVNEAKRLLHSKAHQHLSIMGIAFESGFNSKTTFNTTFKKFTGVSPSQYQQQPSFLSAI